MLGIAILIAVQVLGSVAHGPGGIRSGFIALRTHASDKRPKASEGAGDCDLACGDDAPKKCVPDCNSAVLHCMEANSVSNVKEVQQCRKQILTGIKRARTFIPSQIKAFPIIASDNSSRNNASSKQTGNASLPNKTAVLAADPIIVSDKCEGVCGQNVNSSCVTSCEMELYQCIDHTLPDEEAEGEREECFEKVLAKYKGFQKEWNATHGFVERHDFNTATKNLTATRTGNANTTAANATVYYKVTEADMKMIKDVCDAACTKAGGGAPSSMCVTHCETDMYRCIKETLPDEMDERKQCRKDTQAKYEAWGSSL